MHVTGTGIEPVTAILPAGEDEQTNAVARVISKYTSDPKAS